MNSLKKKKLLERPARKKERLFEVLPNEIRDIKRVKIKILKRSLNKWQTAVLDEPRIDSYAICGTAENTSTV